MQCAESWVICQNKKVMKLTVPCAVYVPKYCRCKMINQFIVRKNEFLRNLILLLCNFKRKNIFCRKMQWPSYYILNIFLQMQFSNKSSRVTFSINSINSMKMYLRYIIYEYSYFCQIKSDYFIYGLSLN